MKEYLRALELAEESALPEQIDDASDPSAGVVRELVEAGYLWAIDISTFDGPGYAGPRITLSGREYLNRLRSDLAVGPPDSSTGWPRVDRSIGEIRRRLSDAENEEQCQAIGLLCRETLISLAQAVHDPEKHVPADHKSISPTDAKGMFDAYIAVELKGSSHEASRRHAKAAYDLANDLQHRRTATFREAALCFEATSSIVSFVAIVSGHRDRPVSKRPSYTTALVQRWQELSYEGRSLLTQLVAEVSGDTYEAAQLSAPLKVAESNVEQIDAGRARLTEAKLVRYREYSGGSAIVLTTLGYLVESAVRDLETLEACMLSVQHGLRTYKMAPVDKLVAHGHGKFPSALIYAVVERWDKQGWVSLQKLDERVHSRVSQPAQQMLDASEAKLLFGTLRPFLSEDY